MKKNNDRILIEGACIVSMDADVGDFSCGDILVEGSKIISVRPKIYVGDDVRRLDGSDFIVLPGLVDTHRHTWQSCLRHQHGDNGFWTYCLDMLGEQGSKYEAEDVYIGTLLGAISALEAGTTTLVDWSHIQNSPAHSDAAISALKDAGIRSVFAHGWPITGGPEWTVESQLPHPADIRRIRERVLYSDDALVTLAMAARGPEMTTMDITKKDLQLARELGIRTTMHVGIKDLGPRFRAIEKMNEEGLLGPDITFVHVCASSDAELKMLADNGVSVSVGPQVEMTMPELGVMPIGHLLSAGIKPSLSGDTETCGSGDIFTQMRFALGGERLLSNNQLIEGHDSSSIKVRDVLEFATIVGAEACGLEKRTGSISPGKDADMIFIRRSDLNLSPVSDAVGAIVLGVHPGNVDTVMVAGRIVKKGGKMIGYDLNVLRERAAKSRDALFERVNKVVYP